MPVSAELCGFSPSQGARSRPILCLANWHKLYQSFVALKCTDLVRQRSTGGGNDCSRSGAGVGSTRQRRLSLDAALHWRRLHGDDSQSSIRLDVLRYRHSKTFGWDRSAIQWAFTLFVLFETWLVPVEGWFVDKYGPRLVVVFGGLLCAVGWVINSQATSLGGFYLGQIIAGIGAGAVYGTCVGNALKWFPDKRGLRPASPPPASAPVRHSPLRRSSG